MPWLGMNGYYKKPNSDAEGVFMCVSEQPCTVIRRFISQVARFAYVDVSMVPAAKREKRVSGGLRDSPPENSEFAKRQQVCRLSPV